MSVEVDMEIRKHKHTHTQIETDEAIVGTHFWIFWSALASFSNIALIASVLSSVLPGAHCEKKKSSRRRILRRRRKRTEMISRR